MSNWDVLGPRVTITRALDGTSRTLPLEEVDGTYLDIAQSPDEGFPPPLAIGSPEQRTDLRTRQTIYRDARRGMGTDELDETQGSNSFRYSQWDTRYANVRVLRPLPVRLGSSTTVGTALGGRIAYVGTGTAKWLYYGTTANAAYYSTATSQWVSTGMANGGGHLARGLGAIFYIHDSSAAISWSADAITWDSVSVADINTEFGVTEVRGLATHDNKLFTLAYNNAGGYALCQSLDPTSGTANWSFLGTLQLDVSEAIRQLFVWKFPPQPERGGLFCLTNHRIWWYDDTADAASTTAWKEWHVWDMPYPTYYGHGHAVRHGATGDLYVMPHMDQDSIWQFTGNSLTPHGPNKRGGLPPNRQGAIAWTAANSKALVCWVAPSNTLGVGNKGMVVAFNEQEGWHHLFDPDGPFIIGSGKSIVGGGLGPANVLTILSDGTTWEQEFYDASALPQYATTARSYDYTPASHDHAKTDIGSPTLPKAGLYVEANAKIPTGATIQYLYRLDDSDQTGAWTSLGTATGATAMPYRVGFPNNTTFRQIELREVGNQDSAGATATPIAHSTIVHATLLPPARFNTVFRVDLRAEKFRNGDRTIDGYGLDELRTWIRGCHGQIVAFEVTHPGGVLAVTRGQAAVTPTEHPLDGLGRYTFQIRDLTTPSSG